MKINKHTLNKVVYVERSGSVGRALDRDEGLLVQNSPLAESLCCVLVRLKQETLSTA